MPGEFYFMALGGLGVSLAGFAGLIAALGNRRDGVVIGWRIFNIVLGGFIVTLAGFGIVALYGLTNGDLDQTVRISSVLIAVVHASHVWWAVRPGSEWESGSRLGVIVPGVVVVGALALNVVVVDIGLLQVLVLALVVAPASIFLATIRDVAAAGDLDGSNETAAS